MWSAEQASTASAFDYCFTLDSGGELIVLSNQASFPSSRQSTLLPIECRVGPRRPSFPGVSQARCVSLNTRANGVVICPPVRASSCQNRTKLLYNERRSGLRPSEKGGFSQENPGRVARGPASLMNRGRCGSLACRLRAKRHGCVPNAAENVSRPLLLSVWGASASRQLRADVQLLVHAACLLVNMSVPRRSTIVCLADL